ncbi:alpha/beta fold hydrolase [Streptococcus equinus]|uniref:alpha/beta fold hydrolase n=1 Tax=Streptococcus equinus TaxID=1335 RepID=UPI00215A3BC8|nr:alpha/beta hydrolase [Streptococcus equinus]UVF02130.1 alpha/beta hydrolase [Streptococcus equinus]
MKKMQINNPNGSIAYWKSDVFVLSRDTLFFLHGLTADHTMFEQQFLFFENDYNIIAWDAPAHGESRPYVSFTYGEAANAIKTILTECGISQVILIGQSMGGFISQAFIRRYPEMVKAFVSIDSSPYGNYYSKSDMWWLHQIEWMAKLFPEKLLKSSIVKQNTITKWGRENMATMIAKYDKTELCHLMGIGYAGFLEDNQELSIPCPTLLIVGEKDTTGKVKAYNREWSKRTGFRLVWIADSAHNSNVDNPVTVNKQIAAFLNTLR